MSPGPAGDPPLAVLLACGVAGEVAQRDFATLAEVSLMLGLVLEGERDIPGALAATVADPVTPEPASANISPAASLSKTTAKP